MNTSATRSGCCASIAAFQRSRASRTASVSGTLTTVDVQISPVTKFALSPDTARPRRHHVNPSEPLQRGINDALADATLRDIAGNREHHGVVTWGNGPRVGDDGVAEPAVAGDQARADALAGAGDDDNGLSARRSIQALPLLRRDPS